jgi:hypothetical protein
VDRLDETPSFSERMTHTPDMDIDGTVIIDFPGIRPREREQLISAHDPAGVPREAGEQRELARLQEDPRIVDVRLMREKIDPQVSYGDDIRLYSLAPRFETREHFDDDLTPERRKLRARHAQG